MGEEKKYGVAKITAVLALALEMGNVLSKVVSQPGPMISKLGFALELSDEVVGMVGFSAEEFKQEILDLDDAEKQQLLDFMKNKFDLADDALEAKIEHGLELVFKAEDLVKQVIAFAKAAKGAVAA